MWKIKSCPKCKGDMLIDKDSYGLYEQCLQCGYLRDLHISIKPDDIQVQTEVIKELVSAM